MPSFKQPDKFFHDFPELLHRPLVWVFCVSVLGAWLRFHDLGGRSLWYDEAVLYHIANNTFSEVIAANARGNSAPPLYALLLRGVMNLGHSEMVLRSISCLAGIAAIPLIFLLCRQVAAAPLAVFSALLVALSPQQIYYSTQLREYSLAFALAIWLLLAWFRFLGAPSLGRALTLGLITGLAILTQYGLGLLIAALNVVALVYLLYTSRQSLRNFMLWGLALFPGLLAAIVVYWLGLKEQFGAGGFGAHYLAHGYGDGTWMGVLKLLDNTKDIFSFAFPSLPFLFLCSLGVLFVFLNRKLTDWCAAGFLLVPFVLVLGAATVKWYPYLGERQAIFLTPMTYVFAAIGLSLPFSLPFSRLFLQLPLVILVTFPGLQHRLHPVELPGTAAEHLRPVIESLTAAFQPSRDIVYVYYGAIPAFKYYTMKKDIPWVAGVISRGNPQGYFRQIDSLIAQNKRTWLIFSHVWSDEAEQILLYLQNQLAVRVTLTQEEEGAWLLLAEK